MQFLDDRWIWISAVAGVVIGVFACFVIKWGELLRRSQAFRVGPAWRIILNSTGHLFAILGIGSMLVYAEFLRVSFSVPTPQQFYAFCYALGLAVGVAWGYFWALREFGRTSVSTKL